jgi:peptidoglycan-N-acetylglucosamine deacetylase
MPGRMIPHRTPFFLPFLYPKLVWRMPADKKELYLTFDDGPVPGPTEFVLDELKKVSANATFFCIGDNIRKHPDVFKKILSAGHAIGNHTFNHLNGWKTKNSDYLRNISQFEELLSKVSCPLPTLFRPPYGRITPSQVKALQRYRIIMWDVLTKDYDHALPENRCLQNSITATRSGSIIVFHDSFKAEKNLRFVLPKFLHYFSENGYIFKSVPS